MRGKCPATPPSPPSVPSHRPTHGPKTIPMSCQFSYVKQQQTVRKASGIGGKPSGPEEGAINLAGPGDAFLVEIGRNWSNSVEIGRKTPASSPPPGQARPSVCELQAPTLNHVSRRSFRAKADHAALRIFQRTGAKAALSPTPAFAHRTIIASIRIVNRKIRPARSGRRSSWRRNLGMARERKLDG